MRGRCWSAYPAVVGLEPEWVTYAEAAAIIGCGRSVVARLVARGELVGRGRQERRQLPSISRASAVEVAAQRATAQAESTQVAEERRRARPEVLPPDDGEVWLSATEAGLVLGMTSLGVRYRAIHGLIPSTRRGQRWWFRRDHVEQAARSPRVSCSRA